MHSAVVECTRADADRLTAELWELGTSGIQEEEIAGGLVRLRAFFEQPPQHPALRDWRVEEERDWVALSREGWEPLCVGERLFLIPAWLDDPTPPGRLRLEIEPGMASGTGYSTPTQLCLEALERYVRTGETVLDVGTGSGILARAALLLGAGKVIACDIDAACLRSVPSALVFAGSARALRGAVADLVVANLNAVELEMAAVEIARVCRAGARVILGGFQHRREAAVASHYERCGLTMLERMEREQWQCVILNAPATSLHRTRRDE